MGAFTYINAKFGWTIEDEMQIGSHSVIMPEVTVGEGSVVGPFSFVRRDVPENVTVIGVSAKVMKR